MNHGEGRAWITSVPEAAGCLQMEPRLPVSELRGASWLFLSPPFSIRETEASRRQKAGPRKPTRMVADEGTESWKMVE